MSEFDGLQGMRRPKPPQRVVASSQVVMGVMPLAQLIVGAMYLHDCPRQPYIPIYLIVIGAVSLLLNVLSILPSCTDTIFGILSMVLSCLVSLFGFCWFIAGNVWIYSIYEPNYYNTTNTTSSSDLFCNKTVYLFAFWTTNLFYILLGLTCISSCCSS